MHTSSPCVATEYYLKSKLNFKKLFSKPTGTLGPLVSHVFVYVHTYMHIYMHGYIHKSKIHKYMLDMVCGGRFTERYC